MIGIYKITNPSNKVYIGQSTDVFKRWKHYSYLDCNQQPGLFNSFNKYGYNNHTFEIIEECLLEHLDEREIYWGEYYNVLNEGLNCRLGEGRGICSEETKQKLKIPKTEEWKRKIGNANRKPKPDGFGTKPEGFRDKMSQINKGIPKPKPEGFSEKITELKSKQTQQYSLEGLLLNEFNSIKEANKYLGKNSHSIGRACRGEVKKAFGYIWKFKIN
jgi:group I intron endonuclease